MFPIETNLQALLSINIIMDPDDTDLPRRGGNDFMGLYVGGAPLDDIYRLITTEESFKCALQLRNAKTLLGIESDLRKALSASSSLKYDGKLKLEPSELSTKELDKEEFLLAVDEAVMSYGLHSFFYLPSSEGIIKYLAEEPHLFTIEQVMQEHESRTSEPEPVLDDNDEETTASISARFRSYDKYERFDISLSRRILETLLSQDIKATICIKYGHLQNYKSLPGQVIFMMALDVSNASAIQDIDEATTAFKGLTLSSYPGENIVDFATEAQRLIKIMSTGYALPYKIGSALLSKVEKTESNYFNQQIFRYQSQVKLMERAIGPLVDPKSIVRHSDYPTYGPLGLCALIQEEYGELKRSNEWPALSSSLPQVNFTGSETRNTGGRRCYTCNSEFHLAPDCTENRSRGGGNETHSNTNENNATNGRNTTTPPAPSDSRSGSGTNTSTNPTQPPRTGSASAPASTWKYIHPADKNQKLVVNEKTYYFCEKCICHHTGKTGFYNTTHTTTQHTPGLGRRRNQTESSTTSTTDAQGNMSPVEDNTSKASTTKKVSFDVEEETEDVADNPDTLHFEGAFHTDAIDDGVWMSEVPEVDSDRNLVVHRPTLVPHNDIDDDWTVPDASKGSNPLNIVQIPVIMGSSFSHVDVHNDMSDIDTPIILQGCMTLQEYLLRNGLTTTNENTHCFSHCETLGPYKNLCKCVGTFTKETHFNVDLDAKYICNELMKLAKETKTTVAEVNTKTSSTYYFHYFDAIDHAIQPESNTNDVFYDSLSKPLSLLPYNTPNDVPTLAPTCIPNDVPTLTPTGTPNDVPTLAPTGTPNDVPTIAPTKNPNDVHTLNSLNIPNDNLTNTTNFTTTNESNPLNLTPKKLPYDIPTLTPSNNLSTISLFTTTLHHYYKTTINWSLLLFNVILRYSLLLSLLTWDTIAIFSVPSSSSLTRKTRRSNLRKNKIVSYQWSYPKHWML